MSYSVLYTENGVSYDISDFVTGIQFGGERLSAVRKLEVSVVSGADAAVPKLSLKRGALLTLLSGEKELVRGVIFREDLDEKGGMKITAYTHAVYLTKNKDTRRFEQQKASQIAQSICSQFGITAGQIVDTRLIFPKLLLREKTLWDMILIALTETTKRNGIKYRVYFREGKLNIAERRTQTVAWTLESGVNLLSASKSSSIEEMRNQIKITAKLPKGNNREVECIVKNEALQKLYGVMQEVKEETGDGLTESSIRQIAETMLKEMGKEEIEVDVEALGQDEIEAGMAVYVVEPVTQINGLYYVEQDDHSIEGSKHVMKLKLSLSDELPELEYERP